MEGLATDARRKASEAAVAIAGACLTDTQLDLLSSILANKNAREIRSLLDAVLPPQLERTGALLPYLVADKLRDFPSRLHDVVVLLTGLHYALGYPKGGSARDVRTYGPIAANGPYGAEPAAWIGTEAAYESGIPRVLKAVGTTISPPTLWMVSGLSPDGLGVGYRGVTPIKGSLPSATGYHLQPNVQRGSGRNTPDDDIARMEREASSLEDSDLP